MARFLQGRLFSRLDVIFTVPGKYFTHCFDCLARCPKSKSISRTQVSISHFVFVGLARLRIRRYSIDLLDCCHNYERRDKTNQKNITSFLNLCYFCVTCIFIVVLMNFKCKMCLMFSFFNVQCYVYIVTHCMKYACYGFVQMCLYFIL